MPPKVNILLFHNCLPHDIQFLKHRTLICLNAKWKDSSHVKGSSPSLHGDYIGMCCKPDSELCRANVTFHDQLQVCGYKRLTVSSKEYYSIWKIKHTA
jgi:hypothetical protein